VQARLNLPYANWFESLRYAETCFQIMGDRELLFERLGWMSYGGGLAARRLRVPLVFEINNGDFITELERLGVAPQGIQRWLAIRIMHRAVHRANYAVATGEGHRRRFIEWWKFNPSRVATVENGSDIVHLLKREELANFCDQPRNPQAPVSVVFVGAFEPWHGILVLLPAFARLVAEKRNVRLVLIGSGTQKDEILRLIQDLGLRDYVELTGQLDIEQVAARLARAEIGVAPYCGWMEYSGLKLFDYKSAGLAVVASGQDGQPATLNHGSTGWIVPPCDEAALAEAIIKLVDDEALRREIGRAARLEAEAQHTWRNTAQQLDQIFKNVMADRAGARSI
jgi:glycosyltransferase involved in cell wall biosynthesis